MKILTRLWVLGALLLLMVGSTTAQQSEVPPGFVEVQAYTAEILNEYPHDFNAFTQGLLWHEGTLYESTGQRGESTLRQVEVETGEVIRSSPVNRPPEELSGDTPLPDYFAEGLELLPDDRLIQLTWTAGEAFIYDRESFERLETINYEGEGWGICTDDEYIYMSDSTQFLAVRDLDSFDLIARMAVTLNGTPIQTQLLNELECVGDYVYANLWRTNFIAQIDKTNGMIVNLIDLTGLLPEEEQIIETTVAEDGSAVVRRADVLNGIAYNPESDTFYVTGKDWPKLYEVRFMPLDPANVPNN